MESPSRADWGDPVLQADTEADVANAIHRRDLERAHAEFEAEAARLQGRADWAKAERDKHNKDGDRDGDFRGTRLWYKFHGQHQAYAAAAKHHRAAASNVWSRLAEGERVL